MAQKNSYTNEQIVALKGADRVRKRPAVMFGSDGLDGCKHSVFEILSNSIDEAREGYGDKILVTYFKDYSVEIEDFGRGIPVDYNQNEKTYNWKLLFCELYAGGKYKNISGETYQYSLGINGLGMCSTQFASEYMDVEIFRDGFRYELHFKAGKPVGEMIKEPTTRKKTGSRIKWRPDLKVFTEIAIEYDYFETVLRQQAIVNKNLTFTLKYEREHGFDTVDFFYENGMNDYISEQARDTAFTSIQNISAERRGRDREDKPEYKLKMSFAFCFSNETPMIEYYHNSSFLSNGGSPDIAVKKAFTNQINALIKDRKLFKKDETAVSFNDIQESLMLISSSFSTETSYANQTKEAISNAFITQAMTEYLKSSLQIYFIENKAEADRIASQILINKRSRETAETARIQSKKTMQIISDPTVRVEKFVDCRSKEIERREIFIVEGDSALGACKLSRDADFQAIMPVRGKILNCLKCDYDKIFKSEIITDLIKVIGCGVKVPVKAGKNVSTFNIDNLRWNKVIICTDADYDGFQIRTLILTMIYRLMPDLIELGYVYIAESPLYEIASKGKTYFAYNESEKTDILSGIGDAKFTIQRSKGLGENEPEMMWMTTMNPASRRLIKITPSEAAETAQVFDMLLGNELAERKKYIEEHGSEYMEEIDVD